MLFTKRSAASDVCLKHYFISAGLLTAVLFGFSAWAASRKSVRSSADAEVLTSIVTPSPMALVQSVPEVIYKPNLRVWVHPDGVRPTRIRTLPGRVVLRVRNETVVDAVLVVDQVSSGQGLLPVVRVAMTGLDRRGLQSEVVLAAGEYVYYNESRPQFKGRLSVAPRD